MHWRCTAENCQFDMHWAVFLIAMYLIVTIVGYLTQPRTNMSKNTRPEIGQECVCPDGVGRVVEVFDGPAGSMRVHVSTYVNNRGCHWDRQNVRLIAINYQE